MMIICALILNGWTFNEAFAPARINVHDTTPRYLRNGRDLVEYVHRDYPYQAFLNACLTLFTMGAPLKGDYPYKWSLSARKFYNVWSAGCP